MRNVKTIIIILLILILILLNRESFNEINKPLDNKNNYLNGIDIIYWINLDRSIDRRTRMELMFQDESLVNIPKKRINAIDGKSDQIENILNTYFLDWQQHHISNTEYGCILSHLLAILEFNNSDNEIGLIMEDDMTIDYKHYWKEPIKACINNAPADWEFIQITYLTLYNKPSELYSVSGHSTGTGAYLINKNGSSKLLNLIYKNDKFDMNDKGTIIADHFLYNNSKSYCYKYPYFIPANIDSEIHSDHIDTYHKPATNYLISVLQEIINFSSNFIDTFIETFI